MIIDDVYRFVQFALKKNNQGNITPAEFNLAFTTASMGLYNQRYGLPEDYSPGKAEPRIAYELTQKISDDFSPFKKTTTLFINTNGQSPKPKDYSHYIDIYKLVKVFNNYPLTSANYIPQPIEVLAGVQMSNRRGSQVIPPTISSPICEFFGSYIQFYPISIKTATMTYLAIPESPLWAFTTPDGRTPLFDPTNSIDTIWPLDCELDLKIRTLQYCGLNLQREDIVGITQKMKEDGQ